jgi:hypothetical protein
VYRAKPCHVPDSQHSSLKSGAAKLCQACAQILASTPLHSLTVQKRAHKCLRTYPCTTNQWGCDPNPRTLLKGSTCPKPDYTYLSHLNAAPPQRPIHSAANAIPAQTLPKTIPNSHDAAGQKNALHRKGGGKKRDAHVQACNLDEL